MAFLVGVEDVKAALNFDADLTDHDDDLERLIEAASGMVLNYLKLDDDEFTSTDDEDIRPEIRAAVIMLVGILKRDPSGRESEKWQPGYLPAPVTAILYPLRAPTLA